MMAAGAEPRWSGVLPNMGHGTDVGGGMEKAWIPPLLLLRLSVASKLVDPITTSTIPSPSRSPSAGALNVVLKVAAFGHVGLAFDPSSRWKAQTLLESTQLRVMPGCGRQ